MPGAGTSCGAMGSAVLSPAVYMHGWMEQDPQEDGYSMGING